MGVSGSANSAAALRWAAAEARLRTAEIWAVHTWSSPMEMLAPYVSMRGVPSYDQQRQVSRALLAAAISHAFGPGSDGCEAGVRSILVEGHPAAVLLRYAAGARLLVLDRRLRPRHPGGVVLGVVARTCIAHAPCPTALIAASEVADDVEASSSSQEHICVGR
ncbi:MAG: universal stress protein [Pseudonocardiaceae bacterium]